LLRHQQEELGNEPPARIRVIRAEQRLRKLKQPRARYVSNRRPTRHVNDSQSLEHRQGIARLIREERRTRNQRPTTHKPLRPIRAGGRPLHSLLDDFQLRRSPRSEFARRTPLCSLALLVLLAAL